MKKINKKKQNGRGVGEKVFGRRRVGEGFQRRGKDLMGGGGESWWGAKFIITLTTFIMINERA